MPLLPLLDLQLNKAIKRDLDIPSHPDTATQNNSSKQAVTDRTHQPDSWACRQHSKGVI